MKTITASDLLHNALLREERLVGAIKELLPLLDTDLNTLEPWQSEIHDLREAVEGSPFYSGYSSQP